MAISIIPREALTSGRMLGSNAPPPSPPRNARIKRQHPLARFLVSAVWAGLPDARQGFRDLVTGEFFARENGELHVFGNIQQPSPAIWWFPGTAGSEVFVPYTGFENVSYSSDGMIVFTDLQWATGDVSSVLLNGQTLLYAAGTQGGGRQLIYWNTGSGLSYCWAGSQYSGRCHRTINRSGMPNNSGGFSIAPRGEFRGLTYADPLVVDYTNDTDFNSGEGITITGNTSGVGCRKASGVYSRGPDAYLSGIFVFKKSGGFDSNETHAFLMNPYAILEALP